MCPSSEMVQLTTATPRPNWYMFGTVTKGQCPLCWGEKYCQRVCPSDRSGNINSLHRLLCRPLVGTGTDDASTMLGKNNGFVVKLRQRLDQPELVAVHCSAHIHELAYKDAARRIQLYKKVDALFLSLYSYRNSPLNRSSLKQTFDSLGETHRIPSRVGGTRWVPHISRSVSNVLKGYKGLVTHLSQVMNLDVPGRTTEQRAKNYYALLHSKDVVYFLHFLADVTAALSDVSTAFQQKEITIADINSEITTCKEVIEKYGKKDGPSLKVINGKDQFLGETIGAPSSAFGEARRGMVQGLLKSLSDRFEEGAEGITAASSIANLKLWPTFLVQEKDFSTQVIPQ